MVADTEHEVTQTTSFHLSKGFELMVGAKASFGVPGIAGGGISSEIRTIEDFGWGSTKTERLSLGSGVNVKVPVRSPVTVTSSTEHAVMDAPATIYSRTGSGHMVTTKTILGGTDCYNHPHIVHEAVPIWNEGKI